MGAVTIKMMRSTNITSTKGVTLISATKSSEEEAAISPTSGKRQSIGMLESLVL